jgi:hypothetical protein
MYRIVTFAYLLSTLRSRGCIRISPLARSSNRMEIPRVIVPSSPLILVIGSGLASSTWDLTPAESCRGITPRLGETFLEIEPQISPMLFRRFNREDDAPSAACQYRNAENRGCEPT